MELPDGEGVKRASNTRASYAKRPLRLSRMPNIRSKAITETRDATPAPMSKPNLLCQRNGGRSGRRIRAAKRAFLLLLYTLRISCLHWLFARLKINDASHL